MISCFDFFSEGVDRTKLKIKEEEKTEEEVKEERSRRRRMTTYFIYMHSQTILITPTDWPLSYELKST